MPVTRPVVLDEKEQQLYDDANDCFGKGYEAGVPECEACEMAEKCNLISNGSKVNRGPIVPIKETIKVDRPITGRMEALHLMLDTARTLNMEIEVASAGSYDKLYLKKQYIAKVGNSSLKFNFSTDPASMGDGWESCGSGISIDYKKATQDALTQQIESYLIGLTQDNPKSELDSESEPESVPASPPPSPIAVSEESLEVVEAPRLHIKFAGNMYEVDHISVSLRSPVSQSSPDIKLTFYNLEKIMVIGDGMKIEGAIQ